MECVGKFRNTWSRVGIVLAGVCTACGTSAQTNAPPAAKGVTLPEITVTAKANREEAKIGPYRQPEWTTHRRFPTTRVYLQDTPWETEFEQWARYQNFRDGSSEWFFQEEATLGLPHRFQFDLYYNWLLPEEGGAQQDSVAAELRYAFADWGKIPLNPTIYLEYKLGLDEKPDAYELKLLLGDEIAPNWHWGANLFVEQATGEEEETEAGVSLALGYTLLDQKLGLGIEMQYEQTSVKGQRDDPEREVLIGPSFQWRPLPGVHLDAVPLFGVTDDAPRVECWLVLGYDFGSIKRPTLAPRSTESR